MTRTLCRLLAATALAAGLTACGSGNSDTHTTDNGAPTPSNTPQQSAQPAPSAS